MSTDVHEPSAARTRPRAGAVAPRPGARARPATCAGALRLAAAWALASLLGCASPADHASSVAVDLPKTPSASAAPVASASAPATPAKELADGVPLEEGHVRFVGMVLPTKGGFDVRGVTIDVGALEAACARGGATNLSGDALLGAKLRIDAELVREGNDDTDDRDARVQRRSGTWFRVAKLHLAEVVAPPRSIEGELSRSKGLYALEGRLVDTDDLERMLPSKKGLDGRRVRLWGQPRDYVCGPNEQCLVEGSLPMFDVARAELLP
jgi:hypothetical protein